jgi:RNA polymerase sigma-70 factor, ECF subfamily
MNKTENLWIEFNGQLLSFIKSRVSDTFIAEDILNDVFIKIHTNIETLSEQKKLESWIYQITRNTIVDYYRTHKKEKEIPDWIVSPQVETNNTIRRELSSCLMVMVNHLPEIYRVAIQLSEIEGKTQQEVAKLENISLPGAKSRVQRGRALLKKMLYGCCQIEVNSRNQIIDYSQKKRCSKIC